MTVLIKPERCERCRFWRPVPNGKPECRFAPPSATAIVVMTPQGPQIAGVATTFPQPNPDQDCAQFKPGIVFEAT